MLQYLKKNWFMLALVSVALVTVADVNEYLVTPGIWLKNHNGPDCVIVLIFFLSGLSLDTRQIKEGLTDFRGTLFALFLIFFIAPFIAYLFTFFHLPAGIILGIFLVATMPTTLSSGVVMTGSAGGNTAHALLITIIANSLAVITIPVTLGLLLSYTGDNRIVNIDQWPIMIKIATLVLLPLMAGIFARKWFHLFVYPFLKYTTRGSQVGILLMVWMALCAGRDAIISGLDSILLITGMVFLFHLVLILIALSITHIAGIGKTHRESIILMGVQKTLPLSVILQVTLFPEFGVALVVCVVHHIIHLIMDTFIVNHLKKCGEECNNR